ncbi:MAG: glycosyltransferase [Bacteroidota bacterium]
MRILLVSRSILPSPGGTSVIVENLAKNFKNDELIVLGGRTLFQKNDVLHRAPQGPDFRYFFSEVYFFGRGYRYFEWFRKWRKKPLEKLIQSIIQKEKIDHVIGVYPTAFYCLAACRAAKKMKVPFSSYFHNTYIENTAKKDPLAPQKQEEIFQSSQSIFVMSKGMKDFYVQKYQLNKFVPLVHTFNDYPSQKQMTGLPGKKERYKLVAIGNFNESNIDATIRFANAIKEHPKFSLHLYTHVPKLLLQKRGLDPALIEHEGFVHPDEVHQVLQQYDIAVLTHGFKGGYGEVEYQTIFPTRTIPLLLSGKPIIAHSPPGSFLNQFIGEHQCAALVDQPSEQAIVETLEKMIADVEHQEKLVKAAQQTSTLFYGPNVADQLKQQLSQSIVQKS